MSIMNSMIQIRSLACSAVLVALSFPSPSEATGFKHVLKPGRYKIDVIVEDPQSRQRKTVREVERCLEPQAIINHTVFEILSDTPATGCPKYEICAGEVRTGFMAQCLPASPPSAVGMFALEADSFRGRVEIKDGDDRLTNIEIQYGDRLGDCDPTITERSVP